VAEVDILLVTPDLCGQTVGLVNTVRGTGMNRWWTAGLFWLSCVSLLGSPSRWIRAVLSTAGKPFESILCPPFEQDVNELLWEVREPYWSDLVTFLGEQL
jgi:hypothetical protein